MKLFYDEISFNIWIHRRPVLPPVTYTEGIPDRIAHSGYIQYTFRGLHNIIKQQKQDFVDSTFSLYYV